MLCSHSDSSSTKESVDHHYHHASDGHYPAKRVRRLFYDPVHSTDIDRVFSEYDWYTQTFSPTLRDLSPTHRHSSRLPHNAPSEATIIAKDIDSRKSTQPSSRMSPFVPKSYTSQVPDETLVSTYLLSTSPTSTSSSPTSNTDHDAWHFPVYSSSPISHGDFFQSPLQQSIMAYAEQDSVSSYQAPHASVSIRAVKELKEGQPVQVQTSHSHPKKHRSASRKADENMPSTGMEKGTTTPHQRNRSLTWASDVTPAGLSEGTSESSAIQSRSSDKVEVESESSSRCLPRDEGDAWEPSLSPQGLPRRRSSAPERRKALPVLSRPRSRSESRFHQTRLDHDTYHDSLSSSEAEEEDQEEGLPKEGRLAGLVSALHYQYVSVGMRIQLAVHRAEKKVSRRLNDKRRRQTTP